MPELEAFRTVVSDEDCLCLSLSKDIRKGGASTSLNQKDAVLWTSRRLTPPIFKTGELTLFCVVPQARYIQYPRQLNQVTTAPSRLLLLPFGEDSHVFTNCAMRFGCLGTASLNGTVLECFHCWPGVQNPCFGSGCSFMERSH